MTLHVKSSDQWQELSRSGLAVVVDPMVVRCGEIFLRGQAGNTEPDAAWSFLESNVGALSLFFDLLVLEKSIPIFNYGDTFDAKLNFDERVLSQINDIEQVLYDVDVEHKPYHEVKDAAFSELRRLYSGPQKIPSDLANSIVSEMSTAEYKWSIGLGDLEKELESEVERKLAHFFLGGLIFTGYSQLLGGDHVIQPKRSRLFLAASLNKPSNYKFEDELYSELKARARSSVTELPWRPTFFPYLLTMAESPRELLSLAFGLRNSGEVRDYREWLRTARERWEKEGMFGPAKREVKKIAAAIDKKIAGDLPIPKAELKVDVVSIAKATAGMPPINVDVMPSLTALWGWFLSSLPGKRYRKLLVRSLVADNAYIEITKKIKSVWNVQA